MKCKVKQKKDDNTIMVDYRNIRKPDIFRYKMMNKLMNMYGEITIFIDTNVKTKDSDRRLDVMLDNNNIEYSSFKIKTEEKKILGLIVNKIKAKKPIMTETMYIAKIPKEAFTQEFYMNCLSVYDIAMGIKPKLSIEEMVEEYREEVRDIFFDSTFFEEFTYDSIIFTIFRSTIDVRGFISECEG